VVTRRGLLAGGFVVLVAGCGEDDSEVAVASPADVLLTQLAAERAFAAATAGAGRPVVARVHARAQERAARLARALSAAGGRPHDAPLPPRGAAAADEVLARGRAALAAHVAALPSLTSRDQRRLTAELVTDSAADVAVLGDAFEMPVSDPFPGTTA
jgi:hypothetical protein